MTDNKLSRRILIRNAGMAGLILPFGMAARAQQAPPPAAAAGRGGAAAVVRNGRGPLRVLLMAGDHPYDYNQLFAMFDIFGEDISWNFVTQPAAEQFFNPEMAAAYDVFVLYDRGGRVPRGATAGTVTEPGARGPRNVDFRQPSAALKRGIKAMLQQGKGMVLFHHALASWVHTWPEYVEMMGGACDWTNPITLRGQRYPFSGFRGGVTQRISVVEAEKSHPIVRGLENGFTITDETYLCPMFPETFHPLLTTDFVAVAENFPAQKQSNPEWNPARVPNYAGWYKAVERSPLVYLQNGHDNTAWSNPAFQTLMLNAIKWAGSQQAMTWARANSKVIFS